jgi:hypothetical protein
MNALLWRVALAAIVSFAHEDVEDVAQLVGWDGCEYEARTYTLGDDDVSSEGTSTSEDDKFVVTHPPTARAHCHAPELNDMEEEPITYTSGTSAVQVTATAIVQYPNDLDQTPIVEATAVITKGLSPGDVLSYVGQNPKLMAKYKKKQGLLTLTGKGSLHEYTSAIRSITFSSAAAPDCLAREITMVVRDADGFSSTDTEHRPATSATYVPAVRLIAVCAGYVATPNPTPPPTLAPTLAPTPCAEYCCEHQLVIWAVPLSGGKTCADASATEDVTFETCQNSCIASNTCGYFSFDDLTGCQQADFSAKCDMSENLVAEELGHDGDIFMLFCSMEGTQGKTCSGDKLSDSGRSKTHADRTLTNCYDRCFADEEKDRDCAYFAYHEHTQECELFPHCEDGFIDADALSQSNVYMMHEEAWSKSPPTLEAIARDFERALKSTDGIDTICADFCKTDSPTPQPTVDPTQIPSTTPTEKPSTMPTQKPSNISPALVLMETEVLKYVSGDPPVDLTGLTAVSDRNTEDKFGGDLAPLRSAVVAITAGFTKGDKLIVPGTSKFEIAYDKTQGVMSVQGQGSPEEYEELLQKVQFEGAEAEKQTMREVTFVVTDTGLESNRVIREVVVCASVCDTYCCDHQLVIWAVPLSGGLVCKDSYEADADSFEACEMSCVGSTSCGYFAFNDAGVCLQSTYESNCDVPDNLVAAEDNVQGVFMLFCAMQDSTGMTCDNEPLPDSAISTKAADRTLTNCYDRCFEDEEKDDDCSYFAYHEHTQMCELFPLCDEFATAPEASQSLVYMMHEEAWGKNGVGAVARRRRLREERKLYLGEAIDESICADVQLKDGSSLLMRAQTEQRIVRSSERSRGAVILIAGVGAVLGIFAAVKVRGRRKEAGAQATPSDLSTPAPIAHL